MPPIPQKEKQARQKKEEEKEAYNEEQRKSLESESSLTQYQLEV